MPDVIFNGPEGRIEGRYQHGTEANAPVALVLHPHPLYGGTMNNKVVYHLFYTFARRGFSVLRFNFRGVGRSQGTYDNGQGELSDAASALDWLQSVNANASQTWICGFSFGAWIAMQLLMRRPEVSGFVAVAPPAGLFDFAFLAPCPSSGLIVQGTNDDVVKEAEVAKLANRLANQREIRVDYKKIQGATHFFDDKLDELSSVVDKYLRVAMSGEKPPAEKPEKTEKAEKPEKAAKAPAAQSAPSAQAAPAAQETPAAPIAAAVVAVAASPAEPAAAPPPAEPITAPEPAAPLPEAVPAAAEPVAVAPPTPPNVTEQEPEAPAAEPDPATDPNAPGN